jgi:tetratricopeptide (TPR) repeat protein
MTTSGSVPTGVAPQSAAAAQRALEQAAQWQRDGRLDEAAAACREILRAWPDHAAAWHLSGVLAYARGDAPGASAALRRAIELEPGVAPYHANLGIACAAQRLWAAALASYERALELDPDQAEVHWYRANVLRETGRIDEALQGMERAVALRPEFVEALHGRGVALAGAGRLQAAVDSFDRAIQARPDLAVLHECRGQALGVLRRYDEAAQSFAQVLALQPGNADAHCARGTALMEGDRLEEACDEFDAALRIRPDLVWAHIQRGLALVRRNLPDPAIASFEQALRLNPAAVEASWNRTLALLLRGDWEEGWQLYARFADRERSFEQARWDGTAALDGKTLFVHGWHGLGDTLMFSRFVPFVANLGARVILEAEATLHGLLRRLEGVAEVVERGVVPPRFDLQCSLFSLPAALGCTLHSVPGGAGYLAADPAKASAWRKKLGGARRLRVGLVWSGNPRHHNDERRSIALERLVALLALDADFYSLQKELRDADQACLLAHPRLHHPGAQLDSFADTAALCSALDLVVSVDTSVAHLAGALGRPVWVLLPFSPDWRWLLERDDSPWYDKARLYRQPRPGDWDSVIRRVAADLAQWPRHG